MGFASTVTRAFVSRPRLGLAAPTFPGTWRTATLRSVHRHWLEMALGGSIAALGLTMGATSPFEHTWIDANDFTGVHPKPRPEPIPRGFRPIVRAPAQPPKSPDGLRAIAVRPPREYDFSPLEPILQARVSYVRAEPGLLDSLGVVDYAPSRQVFGQLVAGKPWWGLNGLSFYGNGEKSIDGDSEESRFVENPYLFVAMQEVWANIVPPPFVAHPVYPKATWLGFSADGHIGWARYDVTSFYAEGGRLGYHEPKDRSIHACMYNAVDLGFPFFAYDARASDGVRASDYSILREPEFIHLGGSCGYAGGCNNASPPFAPFLLHVDKLPSRLAVRLWREVPSASTDAPDVWFVVELL